MINSHAGPSTRDEPLPVELRNEKDAEIRVLESDDDWPVTLAEIVEGGYDQIIIAGGDGTVHAVVNALLSAGRRTTLSIVPLGTGNDLCRTLAIPFDTKDALRVMRAQDVRSIDAVRMEGDRSGFLANAATGGFSGQVAAEVTSKTKSAWGPFAYLRGAVGPLTNLPRFRLSIRFDGGPPENFEVLNLVIANGRMAAGGLLVAPTANPEDGRLDVVIVRLGPSLDLTLLASRLLHGNYVDDENVVHRLAQKVEIESDVDMPFSIDGERCEGRRFAFEIVPKALRIVVGPEYSPIVAPEPPVEVEPMSDAGADSRPSRERLFGLLTGFLLVVKRIRTTPVLVVLGVAVILLLSAWLAQGVVAGEWSDLNTRVRENSLSYRTEALDRLAMSITWLGGGWGTALVSSLVLLQLVRTRRYLTAGTFLAVLIGVLLVEAVLKPLFSIARPVMNPELARATGYAFPSGHALRGVGVYGFMAALAVGRVRGSVLQWSGSGICVGVAVGICWSRVYLGVHWLTDVVMGALLAAVWLAICLFARHRIQNPADTPN